MNTADLCRSRNPVLSTAGLKSPKMALTVSNFNLYFVHTDARLLVSAKSCPTAPVPDAATNLVAVPAAGTISEFQTQVKLIREP